MTRIPLAAFALSVLLPGPAAATPPGPLSDPEFQERLAAGHLEAMAWDIRRSLEDPGTDQWIVDHADEVARFRAWLKGRTPPPGT